MMHRLGVTIQQESKARHLVVARMAVSSVMATSAGEAMAISVVPRRSRKRYKRISMLRRQYIGNVPLAQRSKCTLQPAPSQTSSSTSSPIPLPPLTTHSSSHSPPSSTPPKSSPPKPPASSCSPTSSSPPHPSPPKTSRNSISRASSRTGQARLLSDIRRAARRQGR